MTYYEKCEKLIFYHDKEEHEEQPPYPPKPRRRLITENEEEYQRQVIEWEAGKPHPIKVKPKGNSMTQKYYTDNILPIYISTYKELKRKRPGPWKLQEDNNGSHRIRGKGMNITRALK